MAKNWTMAEAIKAIANQNAEDVKDIYRRYPTAAMLMTRAVAGDCEAACNIIASLPEWATVNKFEKAIKVEVNDSDEGDEVESDVVDDVEEEEKPTRKAKSKAKATKETEASEDSDYASMSGREMKIMLRKAGKLKDLKAKGFGATKADMQAYLEKYGLDGAEADEGEVETDVEVENEAEESKYASLSAQELFKECKRRKLEVKPKRSAKYYVDILEKNDAEQVDDSDEDEDWDDEPEVVEEKPKAKSKKPAKKTEKPAKKPAKVEEAEDEDEDWDI